MLLLIGIRYGYTHVFAETRNAKRTVKPVAMHLEEALPSGERLYTIEMFERWVVYYMIREGRSVARLTPSRARELADEPGDAYLLLQVAQETWRLTQLSLAGAKPEVVAEIKDTRDPLILVKTPKASLKHLTLQRRAPTDASPIPESLVQPNS
jgi:hypothetical protein